jgi:hypothetical protein
MPGGGDVDAFLGVKGSRFGPCGPVLADLGPLPDNIRVRLDAGYDSQVTGDELATRKMTGQIAHKGDKAAPGGSF